MLKIVRNLFENFREYITLITLLIISLFLISLNNKPGIEKFRAYAFGSFAYLTSFVDGAMDVFSPNEELQILKKENAELMLEVNKLRNYALENKELRDLLSLQDTTSYPLVTANVISKLTSSIEGNFIINVGASDSIFSGMPVINDKGLIGLVVNSSKDFCSPNFGEYKIEYCC